MNKGKTLDHANAKILLKENVKNGVLRIPEDVTCIESEAFSGMDESFCAGRKQIDLIIPKTLFCIKECAFQNSSFIRKVVFEPRNEAITIERSCFNYSSVENVEFPLYVEMKAFAFDNCSKLNAITFNQEIEGSTEVQKEAGVIIGYGAFWECHHLEKVEFSPKARVHIEERAFCCTGIEEIEVRCDSKIEHEAFLWCRSLRKVTIMGDTDLAHGVFSNCENLETVEIDTESETGITIGAEAFKECSMLSKVIVKKGWISDVAKEAFALCDNLKLIDLRLCREIGDSAFMGCKLLESVTCTSVKGIGGAAFTRCYSLKSVELSDETDYIGSLAFCATAIRNIYLSDQIKVIGRSAFCQCKHLEEVKIPCLLYKIYEGTFSGCESLKSVSFGMSSRVQIICSGAFEYCYSLKEIDFPSTLKLIESKAFYECTALEKISFKDTKKLLDIYNEAFRLCRCLTEITLPASVRNIGDKAFAECYNLKNVEFKGEWPQKMGRNVFTACSLETIKINTGKGDKT